MGRARRILVALLAVALVAGMVVADAVTLHTAKPSFATETTRFDHLLQSLKDGHVVGAPTERHRHGTERPAGTSSASSARTSTGSTGAP